MLPVDRRKKVEGERGGELEKNRKITVFGRDWYWHYWLVQPVKHFSSRMLFLRISTFLSKSRNLKKLKRWRFFWKLQIPFLINRPGTEIKYAKINSCFTPTSLTKKNIFLIIVDSSYPNAIFPPKYKCKFPMWKYSAIFSRPDNILSVTLENNDNTGYKTWLTVHVQVLF